MTVSLTIFFIIILKPPSKALWSKWISAPEYLSPKMQGEPFPVLLKMQPENVLVHSFRQDRINSFPTLVLKSLIIIVTLSFDNFSQHKYFGSIVSCFVIRFICCWGVHLDDIHWCRSCIYLYCTNTTVYEIGTKLLTRATIDLLSTFVECLLTYRSYEFYWLHHL